MFDWGYGGFGLYFFRWFLEEGFFEFFIWVIIYFEVCKFYGITFDGVVFVFFVVVFFVGGIFVFGVVDFVTYYWGWNYFR